MTNVGLQLYRAGRFDEAISAFQHQLARDDGDRLVNSAGLGESFVAAGRYADAIPVLLEVSEKEKIELPGSLGHDTEISVCEWLSNNRESGLSRMRALVLGLRDGSITYANDRAGGLKQVLLLNYMAVSVDSEDDRTLCLTFIRRVLQSNKATNWPGPVARLLLGMATLEETLSNGLGVTNLAESSELASTDLMKRRKLCNILFNSAVHGRMQGNTALCSDFMRACAALANPMIEFDWHLAKGEATRLHEDI